MNNKTLFLLEILKNKKSKLTIKDLCLFGLCPVIYNQIGIFYETQKQDCKIQTPAVPK